MILPTAALLGCMAVALLLWPRRVVPPVQVPSSETEALRADVGHLAALERYYGNLRDLDRAAAHMHEQLAAAGAEVSEQSYSVRGATFRNIIGRFGPAEGELIIVGAHYDTAAGYPGADDNASGCAALLQLARTLKRDAPRLKAPVLLVAWVNEEPPFFRSEQMGSYVHAKSLREANVKVRAVISLETIGYYSSEPGSQDYPYSWAKIYGNVGDFVTVVGNVGNTGLARKISGGINAAGLQSHAVIAPTAVPGVDFSDHWSYWEHDYPGVMITDTAFYRNPHYHERSDAPETLDYERLARVVRGVLDAVLRMSTEE